MAKLILHVHREVIHHGAWMSLLRDLHLSHEPAWIAVTLGGPALFLAGRAIVE